MTRPATVKLTKDEWTNLILKVVSEIGVHPVRDALDRAIGVEKAAALVERKEPTVITKEDTVRLVRELWPVIPGTTRDEKIAWAIAAGDSVFANSERFQEVLAYVRQRVEEWEAANGEFSPVAPPPKPVEPVSLDAIDAAKIQMIGKNKITIVNSRIIPDALKGAEIKGANVNYEGLKLPAKWWQVQSDPLKGPRLHIYWPQGDGFVGGHYEWTKFPGQSSKTLKNIKNGYLGQRPSVGSDVYFCTISHDKSERTPIVKCKNTWKA